MGSTFRYYLMLFFITLWLFCFQALYLDAGLMSLAIVGARHTLRALRQKHAEMGYAWGALTYLTVQRVNIV